MIVTKVAKRYASALFQQAMKDKVLEPVSEDMHLIGQSIAGSPELQQLLKSQIISRKVKSEAIDLLFGKKLNRITRMFLSLILDKRRENHLQGIADAFDILQKKEQGLIDIEVMVVSRPDPEQDRSLQQALEDRTGMKVNLFFTEDSSLIGGIAVRIGDTVIDGTIKHKLLQLETRFHQQDGR